MVQGDAPRVQGNAADVVADAVNLNLEYRAVFKFPRAKILNRNAYYFSGYPVRDALDTDRSRIHRGRRENTRDLLAFERIG